MINKFKKFSLGFLWDDWKQRWSLSSLRNGDYFSELIKLYEHFSISFGLSTLQFCRLWFLTTTWSTWTLMCDQKFFFPHLKRFRKQIGIYELDISRGRFQNDFDWATYKYRNRSINGRTLYSKIIFLALEVSHEKSIEIVV